MIAWVSQFRMLTINSVFYTDEKGFTDILYFHSLFTNISKNSSYLVTLYNQQVLFSHLEHILWEEYVNPINILYFDASNCYTGFPSTC